MNDYKYVDFGNRLKDLREHSGFKQGQFADEIGITRMSMSNYESGKHCPDIIVLKKMAEFLNCSVDYLVGTTDYRTYEKQQEYDEDMSELSEILRKIPEPIRVVALDTIIRITTNVQTDLQKSSTFNHSVFSILNILSALINCCLDASENETDHNLVNYSNKRFQLIHQLRNELESLDCDSFQYLNSKFNAQNNVSNNSNTLTIQPNSFSSNKGDE